MCGIITGWSRAAIDPDVFTRAVSRLDHRGPDSRNTWFSDDRTIALGHTRLKVIDLEGGTQPLRNETGTVRAVVNGELYDFEAIRARLEAGGHRFESRSDSEIAIHLYEEYGLEFVRHLRGEFAIVLWDSARRRLVAVRDRFGIKPLVWTQTREGTYFASEAKALFDLGVPARWDLEAMQVSTALQYLPPGRTIFEGIRQVEPGHLVVVDPTNTKDHRYWDLSFAKLHDVEPDVRWSERLEDHFREAVQLRLRADVPVAFYLSGGLDSSANVAMATEVAGRSQRAFSLSFQGDGYDESTYATEVAEHLRCKIDLVRVDSEYLLTQMSTAAISGETPFINGHVAAKLRLSRAVRDAGLKVVLTGEGADELLAGYPHLRADLFEFEGRRYGQERLHSGNEASMGIQLPDGERLPLDAVERKLGFVPNFLAAKASLGFRLRNLLKPNGVPLDGDPFERVLETMDMGQLQGRHPVNQSSYLWTKLSLANYILRSVGDGTEMAHSVEGRLPFLDHHLWEACRTMPIDEKIKAGIEKHAFRQAMMPYLPKSIVDRQKHPLLAPPASLHAEAALFELVETAPLAFFSRDKLRQHLQRAKTARGRVTSDPIVMYALSAGALEEHFRLTLP